MPPPVEETRIERYARLIRDVGFPIAVATYLLVRLDFLLREMTAATWALTNAVYQLSHK